MDEKINKANDLLKQAAILLNWDVYGIGDSNGCSGFIIIESQEKMKDLMSGQHNPVVMKLYNKVDGL